MGPEAMLAWLYKGGGRELWVKFRREKMGLHPIVTGIGTGEIFAHSHKPIRNIADMKGLKLRTAGAWADIVKGMGATPVVLGGSDIFGMLERRGIDATEWVNPSGNLSTGFANVAKYVIVPGIHSPSWPYEVLFKAELFDKLPKTIQSCLEEAGELVTLRSYVTFGTADVKAMAQFRSKNEIIELEPAFIEEIKKRGRSWLEEKAGEQAAKGNPWARDIAGSYLRFRRHGKRTAPIVFVEPAHEALAATAQAKRAAPPLCNRRVPAPRLPSSGAIAVASATSTVNEWIQIRDFYVVRSNRAVVVYHP